MVLKVVVVLNMMVLERHVVFFFFWGFPCTTKTRICRAEIQSQALLPCTEYLILTKPSSR